MFSHPETGSDSPIGSDQDRGRDTPTGVLNNHKSIISISSVTPTRVLNNYKYVISISSE